MRIFSLNGANPVQVYEAARLEHRRIVSPRNGGPQSVDLGYNQFAAGGASAAAYAYDRDEICYIADGETEADSSGLTVRSPQGTFMWRPPGVSTAANRSIRAGASICAFAPARADETSHRVAPERIAHWDGNVATRKVPHRVHVSMVPLTPFPGFGEVPGIVHRQVFSAADGCERMDVSHTIVAQGTQFGPIDAVRDEIWWLESGELRIEGSQGSHVLQAPECLVCSAGETISRVHALRDSVFIRFCALAG